MRARDVARDERVFTAGAIARRAPGGGVVFRCESCEREVHDLRALALVHRSGWRIECSAHDDGRLSVEAGRLFGGGLHALAVYADLAAAPWFDPADLFTAFARLAAQVDGVYAPPEKDGVCDVRPEPRFAAPA